MSASDSDHRETKMESSKINKPPTNRKQRNSSLSRKNKPYDCWAERTASADAEFYNEKLRKKYSELRQLILDALAPRKPSQELVESFKTILKQKGEYRPMKLNPIVQVYGTLNVQSRPASAPRPKTNRIKSATKKRPSTACERTKSHEIFNSDLETEKKNRPADRSSSGSDTDDDVHASGKNMNYDGEKHVTFNSKYKEGNKSNKEKKISVPSVVDDTGSDKEDRDQEEERKEKSEKVRRVKEKNGKEKQVLEKQENVESKTERKSRDVKKDDKTKNVKKGRKVKNANDGDSDSSSRSYSSSPNRSKSFFSESEYHLKTTENADIQAWLKEKNKLLRSQKREERRLRREKKREEEERNKIEMAKRIESEEKVRKWMKEKKKEERLLAKREKCQPVLLDPVTESSVGGNLNKTNSTHPRILRHQTSLAERNGIQMTKPISLGIESQNGGHKTNAAAANRVKVMSAPGEDVSKTTSHPQKLLQRSTTDLNKISNLQHKDERPDDVVRQEETNFRRRKYYAQNNSTEEDYLELYHSRSKSRIVRSEDSFMQLSSGSSHETGHEVKQRDENDDKDNVNDVGHGGERNEDEEFVHNKRESLDKDEEFTQEHERIGQDNHHHHHHHGQDKKYVNNGEESVQHNEECVQNDAKFVQNEQFVQNDEEYVQNDEEYVQNDEEYVQNNEKFVENEEFKQSDRAHKHNVDEEFVYNNKDFEQNEELIRKEDDSDVDIQDAQDEKRSNRPLSRLRSPHTSSQESSPRSSSQLSSSHPTSHPSSPGFSGRPSSSRPSSQQRSADFSINEATKSHLSSIKSIINVDEDKEQRLNSSVKRVTFKTDDDDLPGGQNFKDDSPGSQNFKDDSPGSQNFNEINARDSQESIPIVRPASSQSGSSSVDEN